MNEAPPPAYELEASHPPPQDLETAPPPPPRPMEKQPPTDEAYQPPLPPRRAPQNFGEDDPTNPTHYTRDPHQLVAYLIPFPKPQLKDVPPEQIPDRFVIYTPPPPPLSKPAGEKEEKLHKIQRKWQEEVREAKTSNAKTTSWKGVKSKATRGIDWAVKQTTHSNLDFINRMGDAAKGDSTPDTHHDDGVHEEATTKKTVGLTDMVLVYPSSVAGSPQQIQEEFINNMLRTKSKAQRDAVIATGLLPVTAAIDILATVIWPFGGLLEVDGVWAYSSIRGAKIARSTTKRLASSGNAKPEDDQNQLRLKFTPSPRLDILRRYLAGRCHQRDAKLFPSVGPQPTETDVLEAIGWAPSQHAGENRNWEDEQWEVTEVKEDFKAVMQKASREWDRWCKAFVKNPEKALSK
jgi:hypothetical protein